MEVVLRVFCLLWRDLTNENQWLSLTADCKRNKAGDIEHWSDDKSFFSEYLVGIICDNRRKCGSTWLEFVWQVAEREEPA